MECAVVKAVAGLMNTEGGTLLVGIADDGSVVGIEEDFPFLGKKNADGWELWLTDLLTNWLGRAAATDVTLRYGVLDGRTVSRIAVRPVFLNVKGEKKGVFLVRVNSSTRELAGDDAFTYQQKRWPS
jgi:predicted HTH transcriptional regulator